MSCGNHHDTDCSEVLERVFVFIDNELPTADWAQIQHHLDECGPCLQKYDLERTVKLLVRRSCCESAPQGLRESKRILNRDLVARIDAHGEELAAMSARLFASDEAREAMAAFLSRTK